jgi:hypothetical protein
MFLVVFVVNTSHISVSTIQHGSWVAGISRLLVGRDEEMVKSPFAAPESCLTTAECVLAHTR